MSDSEQYAITAAEVLYHACEDQELKLRGLPDMAYACLPENGRGRRIVIAKRGMCGFLSAEFMDDPRWPDGYAQAMTHRLNAGLGVGPIEAGCMKDGALYGWTSPSTDPRRCPAHARRAAESERICAMMVFQSGLTRAV